MPTSSSVAESTGTSPELSPLSLVSDIRVDYGTGSIMTELGAGPGPRSLPVPSGLSARTWRKDPLRTRLNTGTASVPTFLSFTTEFAHSGVQAAGKARPFAPRAIWRSLDGTIRSAGIDLVPPGPNPTRGNFSNPTPPSRSLSLRRGRSLTPRFRNMGSRGPIPVPTPSPRPLRRPVSPHHPPNLATRARVASIPTKHLSPTSWDPAAVRDN